MLLESNLIEGPYVQDILEQPEALRRSLAGFTESDGLREFANELNANQYKTIVLTGMGSSLFALYPLHLKLLNHGYPSLLIETAELVYYAERVLDSKALVLAVSQSGQSAEVLRLIDLVHDRVPLIGVTNTADSSLASRANACVMIQAGPEASVSCKTYIASLLALEWLGAVLTGEDQIPTKSTLAQAEPAVRQYLQNWREHVDELIPLLAGIERIFVTGRGPSLSAAQTGGLILKESARFPAEGMSCAAFRHGPFELLDPQVLVVVLGGDAKTQNINRRLVSDVEQARGASALVDTSAPIRAFRLPEVPERIRPVVEILPIQMISLALAARTGSEAGRFRLATKVTSID